MSMSTLRIRRNESIIALMTIFSIIPILFYSNNIAGSSCLVLSFLLILHLAYKSRMILNYKVFSLVMVNFISIALTVMLRGGAGIALLYLNTLLALLVFNNILIDRRDYIRMHLFLALTITCYLFTLNTKYTRADVFIDMFDTKINVNMVGMYALCAIFHMICFCSSYHGKNKPYALAVAVISIAINCYYIYLSRCRSVLLSILLFAILEMLFVRPVNSSLFKRILRVILVAGLLFVFAYLAMYRNLGSIKILGKPLFSGRQNIWNATLEGYLRSPFIGNGNRVIMVNSSGKSIVSAHNTFLTIMFALGTIPALSFLVSMGYKYKTDKPFRCGHDRKTEKHAQIAFISCILITAFESFFINVNLYMIFLLFLVKPKCIEGGK